MKKTLSSIMQQYEFFAKTHPDKLIALQVGDFYEFIGKDAQIASSVLDLALGNRLGSPFTGFPVRSIDIHLPKLLRMGHQVVLCEQYRDRLRGIFRRRVAKVLTPGTVVEGELLTGKTNNFLTSISRSPSEDVCQLSWADVGTGEFYRNSHVPLQYLGPEVRRIRPSEILIHFGDTELIHLLKDQFKVTLRNEPEEASQMITKYIEETCPNPDSICQHVLLREPTEMVPQSFMVLGDTDAKALDLLHTDVSLFTCLDECLTASGSRLLGHRLKYPSMDVEEINQRLKLVQSFLDDQGNLERFRTIFRGINDIERCWQRLKLGRASPRDLRSIVQGLIKIAQIRAFPKDELHALLQNIDNALEESLPIRIIDGPVLKAGHDAKLDVLRDSDKLRHGELQGLIEQYRQETQLGDQLKACILRTGYFLEFPRRLSPLSDVAKFYQDGSTASKWRYRTKELDALFVRAERRVEEAKEYEMELYQNLVQTFLGMFRDECPPAIQWMAQMDVATTTALIAKQRDYCCPRFQNDTENSLEIVNGRHPVVEWVLNQQAKPFTANDLIIMGSGKRFVFLTGPNMGGKSTFLRQNALIPIMAQAGLYVPAERALMSIVDTVLTRIGASDNLAADKSTFMVEMSEAGRILQQCTHRSLVIVDELGRGTAPIEGIAIAAAVAKELQRRRCRCLFATHLLAVKDHLVTDDPVLFLHSGGDSIEGDEGPVLILDHKIRQGISNEACAIGVARIAGLPQHVLQEAHGILHNLK